MADPDNPLADRLEKRLALGSLGVALAVLLAPALDPGLQFAARDAGRMYHPLKHFIADERSHGRLPVWNPYTALGEPLLGGVVAGPLDPLNLLGVALPFGTGFKAMHLACYLLAAAGLYLWLRGRSLSPAPSVAGALAFTLGGYLTGVANNFAYLRGLAMAPLFLLAFEAAVRRGCAWRIGLAAAAWALMLLGGEAQCWLLAWPFALAIVLLDPLAAGERTPVVRRAIAILALGALFSAPVLLPALLELPRSDRSLFTAPVQWWFAPSRWGELFIPLRAGPAAGRSAPWVPSEYLGCSAILIASLGVVDRRARGLVAVLLVALWLAAGPALGASQVGAHLPVWKSFQYPEKLVGWAALALAGLVALGLDRVRTGARWRAALRGRERAFCLGLSALVAADLLLANGLRPALLPAEVVRADGPLGQWMRRTDPLGRVSTPFELAAGEPLSEEAVFRRWSHTLATLWNVEARVGNMGWYGGLANGRYRLLREQGKPGFSYLGAAATHGAGYLVVPATLENLRLVGIEPGSVETRTVDPSVPAWLVEVPHRPFAYLAERVEAAAPEDALRAVLEPGFTTSGRTVVEGEGLTAPECPTRGSASVACPWPTRCDLRTSSACPATLVVNLPSCPGWTATVDGREVEPVPANFLASAIPVPAGEHAVQWRYRAPGLFEGASLALVGLLGAIAVALRQRRRA